MWPARQCALQQGVSSSPGWHDPRWQGTQLDDRPTVGRLQVPQRVATNYQPRDIKHKQKSRQKQGTDKTKTRQNENKDHCCPFTGTPRCFSAFCCQPQTESTDTERASEFSHLAAEALKCSRLRTGTARRWGTTWRLWFHNRWDKAFVSESPLVSLQGETSPLNRHVFMTLDASLTNIITFSYITRHCITLNAQTKQKKRKVHVRQHLIRAKLSAVRNGPHVAKMGYTLHSTGSMTKTRLNQHMANPSGTKAGLISAQIRDKLSSEQKWCGLLPSFYPNHKGLGYRPRKIELNGHLSEIGQ